MDFRIDSHFSDQLVMGQTATMVMKVEQKVLRSMNLMSGTKVEQISRMRSNIMILG